MASPKRVGIVGFGHIGEYLYNAVKSDDNLVIGFVWNRTAEKISHLPPEEILQNLDEFPSRNVDLIVEVIDIAAEKVFLRVGL